MSNKNERLVSPTRTGCQQSWGTPQQASKVPLDLDEPQEGDMLDDVVASDENSDDDGDWSLSLPENSI